MFYDPRNAVVIGVKTDEMWSGNHGTAERSRYMLTDEGSRWALEAEEQIVEYLVGQIFATIAETQFFADDDAQLVFEIFDAYLHKPEVKDSVIAKLKKRRQQCAPSSTMSPEEQEAHKAYMEYILAKLKVQGLRSELSRAEAMLGIMKKEILDKHPALKLFIVDENN